MTVTPPQKPFPEYKWRWAVFTPTEGLNEPSVYIGVLRALRRCENFRPNSPELNDALRVVQSETNTGVNLVRSEERNIVRNSGQYWKALNLLDNTRGGILLTEYGRRVADGNITPTEFAVTVVKSLELPNRLIENNETIQNWGNLRIKPLELILNILSALQASFALDEAFLTNRELTAIVIPLAGENSSIEKYVEAISQYRAGRLDLSNWADCTPESNDRRMAREFLLFLSHYGFCQTGQSEENEERFYINSIDVADVAKFDRIDSTGLTSEQTYEQIRNSDLTVSVERRKIQTTTYARPTQARFRNNILIAYNSICTVTGVTLPAVLEAAHIVPVPNNGQDQINNGFCFRSDIHRLFDASHMRIDVEGNLHLSDSASLLENYGSLPRRIQIPRFVSLDNINWRWNYY